MELRDYLRILRKGWVLVVLGALLGVGVGTGYSMLLKPKFEAVAAVFVAVQTTEDSTTGDLVQGSSAAQQKVRSFVTVATSPAVLTPVIEKLDLDVTPAELAEQVTASSPLNTVIIEIRVVDEDPQEAANIANVIDESLTDFVVQRLERPVDGGPSRVTITTIQEAVPSDVPVSPNLPLNVGIGLVAGLILGVGAAVLRFTLDSRVHGPLDVEAITPSPIIGGIGYDTGAKKRPLIVHSEPRSPRAEAFRTLRTNLQFVQAGEGELRRIVITSSLPGEGKTTTAVNLAIALAETGVAVVVIDGDLRLPKVAEYMGIEGAVGLTDVLVGRVTLDDAIQHWGTNNLYVLPAGAVPPNPSELLGSAAMANLLDVIGENVPYIIIDAPPLLPVTDAALLSKFTNGAVVVAAAGRIKRVELTAALRTLDHIGSRILGIVMTMLPAKGPDSYGYGYGSYYGREVKKAGILQRRRARRTRGTSA